MGTPTVTCVIPTHRRSNYLSQALSSVLNQTRPPSAIVVVSDVEDAATSDVVTSASDKARIPVVYVERFDGEPGASRSRNAGAALAQTSHIAFLDDDDEWAPPYLERALQAVDATGADLVATNMVEFSSAHRRELPPIRDGLAASDVLSINPGITGSNILVSAAAFASIDGFDVALPVKNDTDFCARYLRAGLSYAVISDYLVLQRKHESGQLTAVTEARAQGTEAYIHKHREHLSKNDLRILRQSVHRIRSRSGRNAITRSYHLMRVALMYPPLDLFRKIRRGRERPAHEVRGIVD